MEETLFTLLGIAAITLGTSIVQIQTAPNQINQINKVQTAPQTEWEYSKLIAEVKKQPSRIAIITISSDRAYAEVTFTGDPKNQDPPQKVRVKLSNDPNFIKILTENNIEIRIAPPHLN